MTTRGTAITGYIARIEEIENVWENVVGKSGGKVTRVKSICAWEDNIKMYLAEMAWECVVYLYFILRRHNLLSLYGVECWGGLMSNELQGMWKEAVTP